MALPRSLIRGEKICLMGRNGAGQDDAAAHVAGECAGDAATGCRHRFRHGEVGSRGADRLLCAGSHRRSSRRARPPPSGCISSIRRRRKEEIRGLLGQMLFSGEEGLKPTEALSGGESARLLFCKLMLQKPNILILDEPTNHLDLEAINALNIALQRYEGTVLLVTHDHDLIDEVATRIWHFEHGKIEDFKGPYEEYIGATTAAAD